jgi:hypothetical protein
MGYKVFIGKDNDKEINFVAEKDNEISYKICYFNE